MNSDLALLMEGNLAQVWSERDQASRLKAIQSIYAANSSLYHVGDQVLGQEAINQSVTATLANIPSGFKFFKLKPVIINNQIGRLIWGLGPDENSIVATGMDIAVFEDGKIKSLYVFLD